MALDELTIPDTIEEALDPAWLRGVLAPVSGGRAIESVELTDVLKTMASKARFTVRFEGDDETHAFCLKAFMGEDQAYGGDTQIRECDFYSEIAPHLTMRVPHVAGAAIDRAGHRAIMIMEDLIVAGARFCSALEAFTPDQAAASLDQVARLHAGGAPLLERVTWVPSRLDYIIAKPQFSEERLQQLMDDPRGRTLSERTRSARLLEASMAALKARNLGRPETLLHGDCHAGNLYWTADGPGFTDWQLIQHGNWAQDVAYHIAAVLEVPVAEREERALVGHYLDRLAHHGGPRIDPETAWEDFRAAQSYGYYHWAITTRVEPEIIAIFMERLGAGVTRHDTYTLLGL